MPHSFETLRKRVIEQSFSGERRRYHRFRFSSQDNAAVADCIGSNLRCAHEWGWCEGILDDPLAGHLYSPEAITGQLQELCESNDSTKARISGMEPVMGDDHLLRVASQLDEELLLQIDTNGMCLTDGYASKLADRDQLRIRLSFKGHDPPSFARLTGVGPAQFSRQIDALQACIDHGIDTRTVLVGVYGDEEKEELVSLLNSKIAGEPPDISTEKLHLCPENREKLEERGFDLSGVLG